MNRKRLSILATTAAIMLSLTGCETKPEDIAKWKAAGNTAKLSKALNDSRQFIRIDAIAALGELKDPKAVDPLGALLKDPDVVVVHKALDALAAIGTPDIEEYMLQAITLPTDPARLTAAKMLGELKSEKAVDALAEALNDEFENVAAAAAVSLGQIGDPKAIPALSKTILEGSVRLRGASAASIRSIGGESAVQPLLTAMGDQSMKVRTQSVTGLIEAGTASEPGALNALNSDNSYERESALSILKGINKVPTTGKGAVWYQLASLSVGENPKIQREEGRKLAEIEGGLDALVEAVAHSSYAIREHAFQALESIGEPAVEPLLAASASAKPAAAQWFNGRSEWPGAPAWQLDLWGAAAALNPIFELDKRGERLLQGDGKSTEDMLRSKEFQPSRELIPLLIGQMKTSGSEDEALVKNADRRRDAAFRKLRAYKQRSKFALMAAVQDEDLEIAGHCAKILIGFDDDPRTQQCVIDNFTKRIATEAETLSDSPFQDAMLELNTPEADALLLKVRPNATQAIRTAEKKYPGVRITSIEMPPTDKSIPAEPFRLKYIKTRQAKELKVVFRPNTDGDWVPNPPLPDELP